MLKQVERAEVSGRVGRLGWEWVALPVFLGLALLVRLPFLPRPGFAIDLALYRAWIETAATQGLTALYQRQDYDYPPVYSYILLLLGHIQADILHRGFAENDRVLVALLKLPALACDVAIVGVLYQYLRKRIGPLVAVGGALAFALNPAVIHDSVVWGQVDAVMALPMLLALICLHAKRIDAASALTALAILIKFQAIILAPLLAVVAWRDAGWRGVLRGALIGIVVSTLLLLPVLLTGQLGQILDIYIESSRIHPFVSMNAYNLWWLVNWLVTGNPHMTLHDSASLLGPINYKAAGLLLFGGVAAFILWVTARTSLSLTRLSLAAAALVTAFFALAPEMHERYLFPALPFLILAFAQVGPRILFAILSATMYFNLDWILRSSFGERWSVEKLMGTGALSVINLLVLLGMLWLLWNPETRAPVERRFGRIVAGSAALAFVVLGVWTVASWYRRAVM